MKIHFSVSWAQGGAKIERVRAHCMQPGVDLKTCARWEIYVVFTEPLTRTDEASVKLRFMFTKTFGGYIGYQWGELPPAYKLSNHQLKMGLIFMARIKRRVQGRGPEGL
jgi:hypothetical protein